MTYPYRPTQGVARGEKKVLVVRVDQDTWDDVTRRAQKENCSTSEMLRRLIEWGLMAEDDWEDEPKRLAAPR